MGVFSFLFGSTDESSSLTSIPEEKKSNSQFLSVDKAKTVLLPNLPDTNTYQKRIEHDKDYWLAYNTGLSHYNRGWYPKAKNEFLKIYDQEHGNAYFTHLIRVYRKIIDGFIKKKKFEDAFQEYQELFDRCPDFTNTDIRNYNKVVTQLGREALKKDLIASADAPEYQIQSSVLSFLSDAKKPKDLKITYSDRAFSQSRLYNQIQALLPVVSYINIEEDKISYRMISQCPETINRIYRSKMKIGNTLNFLYSTEDLDIYLSDWSFDELKTFNAARYAEHKYHLRCVDLAADLSKFIFTVIDHFYILDGNFRVIASWRVPYKIDTQDKKFEKHFSGSHPQQDNSVQNSLTVLGIHSEHPSVEDVKKAFREQTMMFHPDRNSSPDAEDKMKEIIEAYNFIKETGLDGGVVAEFEDEYWTEIIHRETFSVGGHNLTFSMGMVVDPSDWIYASGMSNDGQRIYLGCYSGKVYSTSSSGIVDAIYKVGNGEPIGDVNECGDYLHVMTHSYLYIVDRVSKKFIKSLRLHGERDGAYGSIKYTPSGYIHILEGIVSFYRANGDELGSISFEDPLRLICGNGNNYVFETAKKVFLFRLEQ